MKRWLPIALVLAGCGGDAASPVMEIGNPDPTCHPLALGDCALPWPSSFYLAPDQATATGWRLAIPKGVLPRDQVGKAMDPARLNLLDGFSPATPILVNLKARVDPSRLPHQTDFAASLQPTSAVQLLRADTGERVPLFAEVDKNVADGCTQDAECHLGGCVAGACSPEEDQVLLVRPAIRLRPATRYVVALVGLVDRQGRPVQNAAFEALKRGAVSASPRLKALKPLYDELFTLLEKQGVARGGLTLAWDFRTGSDSQLLGHLLKMRDQGFAEWEKQKLGYRIDAVNEPKDDHLLRQLLGTFEVPSFLAGDKLEDGLKVDDQGNPVYRGVSRYALVVHVPRCAETATKPLPFMVFGHGLFGSAQGEMSSGYEKSVIDQLCMIQIGTDWIGLSDADAVVVAARVIADFTNFNIPTDRLQQAQINFLVLARLAVQKLKDDPGLSLHGKPLADGKEIYYYGISQGGIEGNTFMALSPDVERGVLNVGAGAYSLMLSRSVDFRTFKGILDQVYPPQRDQSLLLALSQSYWDFSDPITFAPYSVRAPLPGLDAKPLAPRHILQQEGIGDAQVPNLATRFLMRTMGLPQLDPPVEPVFGLEVKKGPLDAAYTQWDVRPSPLPGPDNVLPAKDNQAHEAVRRLQKCIEQIGKFLRPTGRIEHTCDGPCVFPPK